MANTDADVVIVGAGLAGLTAADRLSRAGVETHVLEARDRVGGRTWSLPLGGAVFDQGGQWIGPTQKRMHALVHALGLTTHPTYTTGRKTLDLMGHLKRYGGTIPRLAPWKLLRLQWTIYRIERLRKQVAADAPWAAKHAKHWDGMTVQSFLEKHAKYPDVIALMNAAIRVVFGAESGELSLLHFLTYVSSSEGLMPLIETQNGHQETRIVGGAQQLSQQLAARCERLTMNAPVHHISQGESGVEVVTAGEMYTCKRVIVSIPTPLIQKITFEPQLPPRVDQLSQRVSMGATVKCLLRYPTPFWRTEGLSGEVVCSDGPITVVYDNTSACGKACLVAFIVGSAAREWANRNEGERRTTVTEQLARYFGPQARTPSDYKEIDWSLEAWSKGAPIGNFPTGTLSTLGQALREPYGRIHWAGTETAREHTGFMEGALESGERAAFEVLSALNTT